MPKDNRLELEETGRLFARSFDHGDAPMIEAVQLAIGEDDPFDRKPLLPKVNAGAVAARPELRKLADGENQAA